METKEMSHDHIKCMIFSFDLNVIFNVHFHSSIGALVQRLMLIDSDEIKQHMFLKILFKKPKNHITN